MIKLLARERGVDKHGSGDFNAPRSGGRSHNGVDYSAEVYAGVMSPVVGTVTKHGFPYSDEAKSHFRYVEVTDNQGYRHRLFYVLPCLPVGSVVTDMDVVGTVQHIAKDYPGMKNHIHYEIKRKDNSFVDPNVFWYEPEEVE